jgi:thiol-disulfide isomerase/thioredoxin
MQKKSVFLQVFRVAAFIFLNLLVFQQPLYAQQQNPLLQGQMSAFELLPAPTPLPDVGFLDVAGNGVSLSSFRGKLVLLTQWATWCPYCARELPTVNDVQELLGHDKFMVLPISVDKEGPQIAKKYLEDKSLNLPTYSDAKSVVGKILKTRGIPSSILIDQEGREIGRIHGETNWMAPESIQLLKAYMR